MPTFRVLAAIAREAQRVRIRWKVWEWMVKHNIDGAGDKYAKAPHVTAMSYGTVINALVDDIMSSTPAPDVKKGDEDNG